MAGAPLESKDSVKDESLRDEKSDSTQAAPTASKSQKLTVALALTFMSSTGGPLTAATLVNGKFTYNVVTVPLIAEGMKLLMSIGMLAASGRLQDLRGISRSSILTYLPPSVLFIIVNNLRIVNMQYIDPATGQLLAMTRICHTALLLSLWLKRSFTYSQWFAFALLSLAVFVSQVNTTTLTSLISARAFTIAFIICFSSALSSVYIEQVLKKSSAPLPIQNVQLYAWGVCLNAVAFSLVEPDMLWRPWELTRGYSTLTWLLVLHMATSGVVVSWLLKHADSITKLQATSSAMFLTAVLSAAFLGTRISVQLLAGMSLSALSLLLYHGLLSIPF